MKTIQPNRLAIFIFMLLTFTRISMANADDTVDVGAGYDADNQNSYFTIADNTAYDLTNLVFSATDSVDGWNNTWTVGDVAANGTAINYFNGVQAFQADFNAAYAYNVTPGDISYSLSGLLNGLPIQLSFSTDDNASGYFVGFLGLDSFGNNLGVNDYATVASVAAVPVPEAFYLFATGLLGYAVSRKRTSRLSYLFG